MTGKVVCSYCSSLLSKDLRTCPNCGAPVEAPVIVEPEVTTYRQPIQTVPTPIITPETVESVNSIKSTIFGTLRRSRKLLFIALAAILIAIACFCGASIYIISLIQNSQ